MREEDTDNFLHAVPLLAAVVRRLSWDEQVWSGNRVGTVAQGMATGAEGIILQPLWKIHNIDWSVRRNVFETDPSCPSLDLLRRNKIILSRYVNDLTRYDFFRFDNIDSQGDRGKWTINSSGSSVYRHPASKWSRFALDTINSAGIASY